MSLRGLPKEADMRILSVATILLAVCAFAAGETVPNLWLFSTDLGSDEDQSDPISHPGWMDCGDVYYTSGCSPTLFKDDDGLDGGAWVGHPFTSAPQPGWDEIGKRIPGRAADGGDYDNYFDLDSEEQLHMNWREETDWPDAVLGPRSYMTLQPSGQITVLQPSLALWTRVLGQNPNYHLCPDLQHYNGAGAFHNSWHKNKVYISFDDDDRYGWTNGPENPYMYGTDGAYLSVPTDCIPDASVEIWQSHVYLKDTLPTGICTDITQIATELDLGLGSNPTGSEATRPYDDDVDALDWHPIMLDDRRWPKDKYNSTESKWDGDPTHAAEFKHRYWSADHEAANGTDPGSIYGTLDDGEVGTGSMANRWRVVTPAHFGINDGVDIDAFTWIALDNDETINLFGYTIDSQWFNPATGQYETIKNYMLACLFSVDVNDPFTTPNESGGLSPGVIYCSDLEGHYVDVSQDYLFNIDSITLTPEPATLALLAMGGLGVLRRRE
jgi:hypothetical protein